MEPVRVGERRAVERARADGRRDGPEDEREEVREAKGHALGRPGLGVLQPVEHGEPEEREAEERPGELVGRGGEGVARRGDGAHFQDDEAHGRRRAALVRILRGQPIFSDKVYNIFNRELQKYQQNFRQHTKN